ncbi:MAG: MFS transporter [Actinomycetota bacterium]|nr:MFS transporter [Actinomycetota bacterium]
MYVETVRKKSKTSLSNKSGLNLRTVFESNLARMPIAMAPVALVISEGFSQRAVAAGAILVGAFTLGEVFLSSSLAKTSDKFAASRAYVKLLIPMAALWFALAVFAGHFASPVAMTLMVIASFIIGGLGGGVFATARKAVIGSVDVSDRVASMRVTSLDTSLMEFAFMLAPLAASGVASAFAPRAASIATALIALGALVVAASRRSAFEAPRADEKVEFLDEQRSGVWTRKNLHWLYASSAMMGIVEGGVIVAMPTILLARHYPIYDAGITIALLSLGAIVGGTIFTRISKHLVNTDSRLQVATLLLGLASFVVVATSMQSLTAVMISIFLAGLFVSPLNTARAHALTYVVEPSVRGQAYGALYSSYSIGYALFAIVLGITTSQVAAASMLTAFAFGVVLFSLFLFLGKVDSKGRDYIVNATSARVLCD